MSNKRRTNPQPADTIADESLPAPEEFSPGHATLAEIRANATASASQAAHTLAHTIADLEAWRNEIDATIAFLRAQRR
jgi:hypothetical protein